MQSSLLPCYLSPFKLKYLPQHPIFTHHNLFFSLSMTDYETMEKKTVLLYVLIFLWCIEKRAVAHIPQVKFVLNFYMNGILIFYGCSQIF